MITITPTISIGEDELQVKFIHASGPGGQHINKAATAVQIRFFASASPALSRDVFERLVKIAGRRMNKEGVLVIDARRFRSQEANRRDALERLRALIRRAESPVRRRLKSHPTAASREKRLKAKKIHSEKKKQRRTLNSSGD